MKPDGLWYLAHPFASDETHTADENLGDTLGILHILSAIGMKVIAPWVGPCLYYGEEADKLLVEHMLRVDCEVVRRCDGLVLSGHRLSAGMRMEMEAARSADLPIIDLIAKPDEEIIPYLALYFRK